jgi:hypothetical protein
MNREFFVALLCCLLAIFSPATARASTTFPEALRKKLELDAIVGPEPGCQLCHSSDAGGLKTAVKPFGRAVGAAGAVGASIPSLLAALDTLDDERTDSDHDGAPDIDELRAGSNPNVGADGSFADEVPLPETGCAVARSAAGVPPFWLLLALLLGARRLSRRSACLERAACRRAR